MTFSLLWPARYSGFTSPMMGMQWESIPMVRNNTTDVNPFMDIVSFLNGNSSIGMDLVDSVGTMTSIVKCTQFILLVHNENLVVTHRFCSCSAV